MEQENEREGQKASYVLDTSVLIAGERGLTTIFSIIEYPPAIKDCHVIYPDKRDFDFAMILAAKLRIAGTPIGCADILIASICINRHLILRTKDKDFNFIKKVEKDFDLRI